VEEGEEEQEAEGNLSFELLPTLEPPERRKKRTRKLLDRKTQISPAVLAQRMEEDCSHQQRRENLVNSNRIVEGNLLHHLAGRSLGFSLSRAFRGSKTKICNICYDWPDNSPPSFSDGEDHIKDEQDRRENDFPVAAPGLNLYTPNWGRRLIDAEIGETEEEEVWVLRGMHRKFETIVEGVEGSTPSVKRLRIIVLDTL